METNDMLKMLVLMQLMHQVPPFLKEKMLHDLLKTLDYKLTEPELKELHDYLNPPKYVPFAYGITQGTSEPPVRLQLPDDSTDAAQK